MSGRCVALRADWSVTQ